MKYHRGEPGVVYPEGGRYLDSADTEAEAWDLVFNVYTPVLADLKKFEVLGGYTGEVTLGVVPAVVSMTSGGKWQVHLFRKENNESPEVE